MKNTETLDPFRRRFSLAVATYMAWAAAAGCSSTQPSSPSGGGTGASRGAEAACTVVPAAGCAAGEKCARERGAAAACEENGTGEEGAACTTGADCAADLYCVDNLCHKLCTDTCSETNYACLQVGYDGELYGYGACSPQCNLLGPEVPSATHAACAANQNCQPSSFTPGATLCVPLTTDAVGLSHTCTEDADCLPGLLCEPTTAGAATGSCWPYCEVGGAPCPAGNTLGDMIATSCVPFSPALIVQGVTMGVCLPTSGSTAPDTCGQAWAADYFSSACASCIAASCCQAAEACVPYGAGCPDCLGDTGCPDEATTDAATLSSCMSQSCSGPCGCNGAC